jgi:NADPH-dependent 2,4-dienoyl-CoA reductase/sulfur reductase-like enzyme
MRVVIIGNGVAGIEAARAIRAREPRAEITLVSEESDHFFSRTALMWVHTGQLSHRDIEPYERDLYERERFVRVRARATSVDTEARRVVLAGGREAISYDVLLVACGSRPRPAPFPGGGLRGVGHFVTLQDLEWYEAEIHGGPSRGGRPPNADAHLASSEMSSPYRRREVAAETKGLLAKRVVVIGGGLVGIEAVEVARAARCHVTFLVREAHYFPVALDARESGFVAERLREHGVDVRLDHEVTRIEGDARGNVARVETSEATFEADCAVVAIGVDPNTEWLHGGGIELDARGGIVVNERLETSVDGVFAAGDCASVRWLDGSSRPEQLWYTARDQGRAAARAMLGDPDARYARGTWYNSAKLADLEYTTVGLVNVGVPGERDFFFEERGPVRSTTRIVLEGERVIGFNLLGRRWDHSVLVRFVEERRDLAHVLANLGEAAFDTEFVPPLRIREASAGRS